MKKLLYAFTLVALPGCLLAQPVLDSADYYSVGQHITYKFCNAVPAGPAGAAQTWNFASVTDSAVTAADVIAAASPANMSVTFGGVESFLHVSDTATLLTGANLTFADITYDPPIVLLRRPVTYLDTATGSFVDTVNVVTPPVTATGGGTYSMLADGYGTLITPFGTFNNTLRIKLLRTESDSSLAGSEDISFASYMWYDSSHVYPLMRVDSIVGVGALPLVSITAAYYTTDTTLGVTQVNKSYAPAFAHLDDNGLVLNTQLAQGNQYKIGLVNLKGQIVFLNTFTATGSIERFALNTPLAAGTYLLSVSPVNGNMPPITVKVVKQ